MLVGDADYERLGVLQDRARIFGGHASAPHAPVVGPGIAVGKSRVILRRPLRVELDAHAAVGLARDRDDHVDPVLGAANQPRAWLRGRYLDSRILRAAQRRAPGAVEVRPARVISRDRLVDYAAW